MSDLTYTGSWVPSSDATPALGPSASAYTGTADGVEYTVTVGTSGSGTTTSYTWTSTDPTDASGGHGIAQNGTVVDIGTQGIEITFAKGTTYSGASYQIHAGTEPDTAVKLASTATGAGIVATAKTTSAKPAWTNTAVTITGGGVGSSDYGTAVEFMSAAQGQGMGSYTVTPGVKVTTDPNTWAATYTAGVQYSVTTGP